mgnify:CR=1 FL=1
MGIENELDEDEIAAADAVILAIASVSRGKNGSRKRKKRGKSLRLTRP